MKGRKDRQGVLKFHLDILNRFRNLFKGYFNWMTCYTFWFYDLLPHRGYRVKTDTSWVAAALTRVGDVYRVWFTVIIVHRNIQVVVISSDCIQLPHGIWELVWGKWADLWVKYTKGKPYLNNIIKTQNLPCCNLSWFWQVKYSSQ